MNFSKSDFILEKNLSTVTISISIETKKSTQAFACPHIFIEQVSFLFLLAFLYLFLDRT